jgi:Zn-dependent protease
LSEDLLYRLIAVAIMLVVGFPIHEFSHALAAFRLGDSTARYMGRLTLNPRAHLDPLGAGVLALSAVVGGFFLGWAKPTPVNPTNLQGGRRGEAIVAAAGPVSNLIMALVVVLPLRLIAANESLLIDVASNDVGVLIWNTALYVVLINVFLFLFNLLPVAPLDGWKVLLGLVDLRTSWRLRQFEQYGIFLLLLVFLLGGRVIAPIGDAIFRAISGGQLGLLQ